MDDLRELPSRCNHLDEDISPILNSWDEQGYFVCLRCGFKIWEGTQRYTSLKENYDRTK
jgi:hypothetical protein